MSNEGRLKQAKNSSLTEIQRGRSKKADTKDIRISFRVDWSTYKKLVEKAGGKRQLSSFIRKALGVE